MHARSDISARRRERSRHSTRGALLGLVAGLVFAACSSGAPMSSSQSTSTSTSTSAALKRSSSTAVISEATKMICGAEGHEDISSTLGVETVGAIEPTWVDHEYSCRYRYTNGALRLSVKQLASASATHRYFENLAARLVRRQTLHGLGEGAFTTANGSVVVSKDNKILTVDIHELPAQFGNPSDTRANVAISVAATIMGCWTEA